MNGKSIFQSNIFSSNELNSVSVNNAPLFGRQIAFISSSSACVHKIQRFGVRQNCFLPAQFCQKKCQLRKNMAHYKKQHSFIEAKQLEIQMSRKIQQIKKNLFDSQRIVNAKLEDVQSFCQRIKQRNLQKVKKHIVQELVRQEKQKYMGTCVQKIINERTELLTCHEIFNFRNSNTQLKAQNAAVIHHQSQVKILIEVEKIIGLLYQLSKLIEQKYASNQNQTQQVSQKANSHQKNQQKLIFSEEHISMMTEKGINFFLMSNTPQKQQVGSIKQLQKTTNLPVNKLKQKQYEKQKQKQKQNSRQMLQQSTNLPSDKQKQKQNQRRIEIQIPDLKDSVPHLNIPPLKDPSGEQTNKISSRIALNTPKYIKDDLLTNKINTLQNAYQQSIQLKNRVLAGTSEQQNVIQNQVPSKEKQDKHREKQRKEKQKQKHFQTLCRNYSLNKSFDHIKQMQEGQISVNINPPIFNIKQSLDVRQTFSKFDSIIYPQQQNNKKIKIQFIDQIPLSENLSQQRFLSVNHSQSSSLIKNKNKGSNFFKSLKRPMQSNQDVIDKNQNLFSFCRKIVKLDTQTFKQVTPIQRQVPSIQKQESFVQLQVPSVQKITQKQALVIKEPIIEEKNEATFQVKQRSSFPNAQNINFQADQSLKWIQNSFNKKITNYEHSIQERSIEQISLQKVSFSEGSIRNSSVEQRKQIQNSIIQQKSSLNAENLIIQSMQAEIINKKSDQKPTLPINNDNPTQKQLYVPGQIQKKSLYLQQIKGFGQKQVQKIKISSLKESNQSNLSPAKQRQVTPKSFLAKPSHIQNSKLLDQRNSSILDQRNSAGSSIRKDEMPPKFNQNSFSGDDEFRVNLFHEGQEHIADNLVTAIEKKLQRKQTSFNVLKMKNPEKNVSFGRVTIKKTHQQIALELFQKQQHKKKQARQKALELKNRSLMSQLPSEHGKKSI